MSKIAVAIVVSDGRVLMVRRRQKEGALHWQFPSGSVETGETCHTTIEMSPGFTFMQSLKIERVP